MGALLLACGDKPASAPTAAGDAAPPPATAQSTPEETIKRGKIVYLSNCTACHNRDPRKPGGIGPDVWGSSEELLRSRILGAAYPAGYKPKRTSNSMKPLPHLERHVPALAAWLNSAQP